MRWVIEGQGVTSDQMRAWAIREGVTQGKKEFLSVWPLIRKDPELLRLHRQFQPNGVSRG